MSTCVPRLHTSEDSHTGAADFAEVHRVAAYLLGVARPTHFGICGNRKASDDCRHAKRARDRAAKRVATLRRRVNEGGETIGGQQQPGEVWTMRKTLVHCLATALIALA